MAEVDHLPPSQEVEEEAAGLPQQEGQEPQEEEEEEVVVRLLAFVEGPRAAATGLGFVGLV